MKKFNSLSCWGIVFMAGAVLLAGIAPSVMATDETVEYYTCGMHPSVRVSPDKYAAGDTKCPICAMPLTPVSKQVAEAQQTVMDDNVYSQVSVKMRELQLAGVETETVVKRHLFKEIRTVGIVAFDPQLVVAQEEYVAAYAAFEKIKESNIPDVVERAKNLLDAARNKLLLLGLSEEQINGLRDRSDVQTNLILPQKTMWIYGDIYEFERTWVRPGMPVKVFSVSHPGHVYQGVIASINPVVDPKSRAIRFRAQVDNSDLTLQPNMYVDVVLSSYYSSTGGEQAVLAIPKEALLDTGRRKIVWVDKGNGRLESRIVDVGPVAALVNGGQRQYYPVLEGLKAGEKVVAKGNFLIDSQSQISGAVSAAYGGALSGSNEEQQSMPPGHAH